MQISSKGITNTIYSALQKPNERQWIFIFALLKFGLLIQIDVHAALYGCNNCKNFTKNKFCHWMVYFDFFQPLSSMQKTGFCHNFLFFFK